MELFKEILAGQQYVKLPVSVTVCFADEAGQLMTLEGPVAYGRGDAIVTGVQGERWPIRRQRFDATYEALDRLVHGQAGGYVKKPNQVHAIRNTEARQILLDNGVDHIQAQIGDWLVADATGSIWVVAPAIFAATYVLLDKPA